MHNFFKVIGVLMSIGLFSAISLSFMAEYAYPLIEKNREAVLRKSIYTVLPGTEDFKLIDVENKIYQGIDKRGVITGYALFAEGNGYQGSIKIMIGIDSGFTSISGLKILENVETPGLGAKISDASFENQFIGKSVLENLKYIVNKKARLANEVDAISGATISTRAVVRIVNDKIEQTKPMIKENE